MTPEEKKKLKNEYKKTIVQQSAELKTRMADSSLYDIEDTSWAEAYKEEIRRGDRSIITSVNGYEIYLNFTKIKVTCDKGYFEIGWESLIDENKNVGFIMYDDLNLVQEYKDLGIGSDDFEHVFKTLKNVGYKVQKG